MQDDKKKFYITTAIPYVNARPHLGHALEFVQADTIARYQRRRGKATLLLSGSDDNALKNVRAAEEAGVEIQSFVDTNARIFQELASKLKVEFDVFQKGSDTNHHYPSSQKLWELCSKAGDIYKKAYAGLYCVGCETFYSPDELNENGECFEHPGHRLEKVSEENYFFRLSKYQQQLLKLISSDALKIIPETRKNEMLAFLSQPLQDISISRSNERAKNWGVPVPGDNTQRIYVWFDALNIYQTGVGFGWDEEKYNAWWPADLHVIGKGIIRFHAIYWPAFLLSAKLQLPKTIFVHGYITVDGQKMSKTLGNVVDPIELIEQYGGEAVRYYLLREIPSVEDGDFNVAKFKERYNADLANGLGNLVARVATLGQKISPLNFDIKKDVSSEIKAEINSALQNYELAFKTLRLNEAVSEVWKLMGSGDRYINENKPWAADGASLQKIIANAGYLIVNITNLIEPFIPETAEKVKKQIVLRDDNTLIINKGENLFPRL